EAVNGPWPELAARDLKFHEALVAAAQSPRLVRMFRTLMAETQLCLIRLEKYYPGRADVVGEHQQILDAMKNGDLAAVDGLVLAHRDTAAAGLSAPGRATAGGPVGTG